MSYFVGTAVMLGAALTSSAPKLSGGLATASLSWIPWTGGLFGAIFIATSILTIPRLGAATVLALIVVGQMLGSLVFDHFGLFGMLHRPLDAPRLTGAGFLVGRCSDSDVVVPFQNENRCDQRHTRQLRCPAGFTGRL